MAFHLHRLKLVGRPLHRAGYHKTDAADLAAARLPLASADVAELAKAARIDAADLRRVLTARERREWAFYRASATDPMSVWNAARAAWKTDGKTDKAAARIMGFTPATIANLKRRGFVLSFEAALKLTTALNSPLRPEDLLPLPRSHKRERNR